MATAPLPEFITLELHNSLCRKIAELTRVVDRLFRQYYEQSFQLEDLKRQATIDKAAKEDLDNEIKTLTHRLEKLKDELESEQEVKERCIADRQSLVQQVQSLSSQTKELEEENDRLLKDLNQTRNSMEDVKLKLQHYNESSELLNDQLTHIAVLEEQVKNGAAQNSLLVEKNIVLSKELENLKMQQKQNTQTLKTALSESDEERQKLQSLVKQLQQQLKSCQLPLPPKKQQIKTKPQKEREYWLESLPKVHVCVQDILWA